MPRHAALIDYRPWLLASLAASVSYFLVRDMALPGPLLVAWKGAAVASLAAYAASRAVSTDGWMLATALTLGALGDMVLEGSLVAGGALFAAGHVIAVALFLRNPRSHRTGSQKVTAAALALGAPLIAILLALPDPRWPMAAAYAAIVGTMAACAWISRFPRYRAGIGGVLFVASDLLIFAREGQYVPEAVSWWLVWPLYYAAQLLITIGVVRTLRGRA